MAAFYQRYVPTVNVGTGQIVHDEEVISSKRRRVENKGKEHGQEPSQRKQKTQNDSSAQKRNLSHSDPPISVIAQHNGVPDLQKQSKRKKKLDQGPKGFNVKEGRPNSIGASGNNENDRREQNEPKPRKYNKAKEQMRMEDVKAGDAKVKGFDPEPGQSEPHARIRAKFSKAKAASTQPAYESAEDGQREQREPSELIEAHGLEPIPQPPQVLKSPEKPTFSSLPPWLARPLRVDANQSIDFADLDLDPSMVENLKHQGLEKAFAVQSAVVPLLLRGSSQHRGDICISAATGSGKTLAYVLPLMHTLRRLATTKLRVLVVVPTRELVKQAKDSFDACSTGTNVRISTAVGSKSLSDEEDALVERYEVWDPEDFQAQQDTAVDWSRVTMESLLSDQENEAEVPANFVVKYRSKVDVLICTPGRLVDHIQSTKGFTLDHVQWLVIDEADRLLNESFQEWVDVVVPALDSRASFASQDRILRHMRLDIPQRAVQKVMLSATMTNDVGRLGSLKLQNPKMLIVGSSTPSREHGGLNGSALEQTVDGDTAMNLPSTLNEYAVPVGDGTEKPLFLLELLRSKVDVFNLSHAGENGFSHDELHSESSSSDSSESDSDSTSSSGASSIAPSSKSRRPVIAPGKSSAPSVHANSNTALIFTRSTESANRLSRLLSLLSKPIGSLTTTLTKSSTSSSSRKALANLRRHHIRIIIATDRASRGLDLPELGHVISYDVPTRLTTYVHRVGRTARAGKTGCAWTLLVHHEARWFWNEIGKGRGFAGSIVRTGKVQRCRLKMDLEKDSETRVRYEKALKKLGEDVVGGDIAVKTED